MASELNPYCPQPGDDLTGTPFAGRQKAFDFLYGQWSAPVRPRAALIVGRQGSGKTALLRHVSRVFDDSLIAVYLPLKSLPLSSEVGWLRALADATTHALSERNFTLSRLPELGEAVSREWFSRHYLPEVLHIIRRARRLVYLLDDADALIQAVEAGALPDDSVAYLNGLVQEQVALALTLDARYEDDIGRLIPLVALTDVFRLANLTLEDTAWLLTEPVKGRYSLTPEAVGAVHQLTGGQPGLLQRVGCHLYRWQETHSGQTVLTSEAVKQVSAAVYNDSLPEFKAAWAETTRNERLVLTAMSSLLYADPLSSITPEAVEAWLVETDYPLDTTAIHAALRGLEYREMVESDAGGLRLSAGLFQTWLLDNARLNGEAAPTAGERRRPGLALWAALGLLAVLMILLALISSGQSPNVPDAATAPPTVTLAGQP